jgi:tripartite-type tricarboxylate transporter receptor subunit TctC
MLSRIIRGSMLGLAASVLFGATGVARAADFPSGPIRWIVPYGTGGSYDRLARGLAPLLSQKLGVPVTVENIPGPDGYNRVYNAKPDGLTISLADPVGETTNAMVTKLPYDLKNFTWMGRINASPNLMVASKKSGFKSFADLKKQKEPIRVGVFGIATPLIQAGVLFDREKIPMVTVNYKNIGDMIFGAVRGDVDVAILGITPWLKHIEAGSVAPLLVWDTERDPRVPNTQSLKEINQAEIEPITNHRSMIAPPKLPKDIREKLVAAIRSVTEQGEGLAWLKKTDYETNPMWGDQFAKVFVEVDRALNKQREMLVRIATQN